MEITGVICSLVDATQLDQEMWVALIALRPDLVPPKPRIVKNPATGEEILAKPSLTAAHLIIRGEHLGSFVWSSEEDYIVVSGYLADVQQVAEEVAQKLGGRFLFGDQLKQWDRQQRGAR